MQSMMMMNVFIALIAEVMIVVMRVNDNNNMMDLFPHAETSRCKAVHVW